MLQCFNEKLMERRTFSATEVQLEVYMVSALYAGLNPQLLRAELRPPGTIHHFAQGAARKAIGLLVAPSSNSTCNTGEMLNYK